MITTLRSPSSTFANLLLECTRSYIFQGCREMFDWVKHRRAKGGFWRVFHGEDVAQYGWNPTTFTLLLLPPPAMFFSPSPFPLSVSALVARGHFVTENTSFSHLVAAIQWSVCTNKHIRQRWHAPTHLPPPPPLHLLSQTSNMSSLLARFLFPSLTFTLGVNVPLHEVGYTSCCPGNPRLGHYPAPLRHTAHCKLGHQTTQAC